MKSKSLLLIIFFSVFVYPASAISAVPVLKNISPNVAEGYPCPVEYTLTGNGFETGLEVEVEYTAGRNTRKAIMLDESKIKIVDKFTATVLINTQLDPDSWKIRVRIGKGAFSNSVGLSITGPKPGSLGYIIGNFAGIEAMSNGECNGTLKGSCDYICKAKYQCVDLVKRYYRKHYPNIKEINSRWFDAQTFWERNCYSSLIKTEYTGGSIKKTDLPRSGDMIFFDTGHKEGHVAIVTDVNRAEVKIIQQNIDRYSAYDSLALTYDDSGKVRIGRLRSRYSVVGWLTPSADERAAIELIGGCSKQNELSRAEAKELILGAAKLPNEIIESLVVHGRRMAPSLVSELMQYMLRFPDYVGVRTNEGTLTTSLTELGKQYVRGEKDSGPWEFIPVLAYVGEFGEITEIVFENEERSTAVVEYTENIFPTPFGLLDTMVYNDRHPHPRVVNRQAVLKMYDDGWRVADVGKKASMVKKGDDTHAIGQDGIVLIDTDPDNKFVRIPLLVYMKNNPGLEDFFTTRAELSDYFTTLENLGPSEKSKLEESLEESDKAYKKAMGQKGGAADKKTKNTPNATTVNEADSKSAILEEINRLRILLPEPPSYLFDTSTTSKAIATVWIKSTALVRGVGDIQQRYDEAYLAAVEYLSLADVELSYAQRLLMKGDIAAAKRHISNHKHLVKMYQLSNETAIKLYLDDIESANILARGFYDGSKEAIDYGVNFAGLGPVGSLLVDIAMLSVDFAVDFSDAGMDEATKSLVKNVIIKVLMEEIEISEGTTEYIGRSDLYDGLSKISGSPEVKKQLMSFISKSTAHGVEKLGEISVDLITEKLSEYFSVRIQLVSATPYDLIKYLEG